MFYQRLVLSLSLLGSANAFAEDGSAEVGSQEQQVELPIQVVGVHDLEVYQKTRKRFLSRMSEFEEDTSRYISYREQEERYKLSQGYDAVIASLEELGESKRDQAVDVFKAFLEVYGDSPYASHVRFRLAELYFEVQKQRWYDEMESYTQLEDRCMSEGDDAACEELGEMPKVDLAPAISLYQRIVEDNVHLPLEEQYEYLDGAYYMLGFAFNEQNSRQRDEIQARKVFQELVRVRPDSSWADAAHLFIGNFLFDENDFDGAVAQYRAVYEKGEEGDYYGEAMYQLAWAHYKQALEYDEYLRALAMFVEVLEFSDRVFLDTGHPSDFRPDAIKYMAISFNEIADFLSMDSDERVSPVDVAQAYFKEGEPREYEWDVYVELATVLSTLGDDGIEDAIRLFSLIQSDPRWKNNPENPNFQMKIVKLHLGLTFQDLEASGKARVELTNRYNDDSEWAEANRNDPEALATARAYIENSLSEVAIEYRYYADETGQLDDFVFAANKFREYLDKFPMADQYYKQQWYLADTLYYAKMYDEAVVEYELLIKSRRSHDYVDGSIFQLFQTRRAQLFDVYENVDFVPDDAEIIGQHPRVDKRVDPETNEPITIPIYQLGMLHQNFVDSIDRALSWEFETPEDPDSTDWGEVLDASRGQLMYVGAQIYFYHNHYDEARRRLLQVLDNPEYRQTLEGSFAASMLVNSYKAEGDLANLRLWTHEFVVNPPGPPNMVDPGIFKDIERGTAFNQCSAMIEGGDREGAAQCFLQFIEDFPDSEHVTAALYNAANSFQLIGDAVRAIELFEEYVRKYPGDERSESLYFRIANNYESTFELKRAVFYYEELVRLFPKNVDGPAAWYNAAFLKIGLGDHSGAARSYEAYARKFPDEGDVEETFFLAGKEWEEVGNAKAKQFYTNYLRDSRFKGKNVDHTFIAKYKLADYSLKDNNKRQYNKWLDEILADFKDAVVDENKSKELGYYARHYAAKAAFREVRAAYDVLILDTLSGDDEKDMPLITVDKPAEVKAFGELTQGIASFQDYEYTQMAMYLTGASLLYYAKLGLSVDCPANYSDEMCDIYMEVLDEQIYPLFYPVRDQSVELLEKVISTAKKAGRHVPAVDLAYNDLNKLNPKKHPAIKFDIPGGVDSSSYPILQPFVMSAEESNSEGEKQ